MSRLIFAIPAFAASCGILSGVFPMPEKPPLLAAETAPRTAIIGADEPVFLGRMVVTATPL